MLSFFLILTIKQVAAPTVSEFAFAEHVVAELYASNIRLPGLRLLNLSKQA